MAGGSVSSDTIALTLFGIGNALVGIFIALVLIMRYIAFTLPDRIYRRSAPAREVAQSDSIVDQPL